MMKRCIRTRGPARNTTPRPPRPPRQGGFTLVELMVSLVILSIVLAGTLGVGRNIMKGFGDTRQLSTVERSARASIDLIADAIRTTSPGISTGNIIDMGHTSDCSVLGVADSLGISITNDAAGPDALTLIHASGGVLDYTTTALTSTDTTVTLRDASQFTDGDGLVLLDTSGNLDISHFFRVASIAGNTLTLTASASNACGGTLSATFTTYPATSIAVRSKLVRFFVDDTAGMIPLLYVDTDPRASEIGSDPLTAGAEPIAPMIEDLQIALGIDDGDGDLTELGVGGDDDEWRYNHASDSDTVPDLTDPNNTIRAVRITLVAKTDHDSGSATSTRPAAEDRVAGSSDVYRRRVLSTVVEIRNLAGSPDSGS